MLLSEKYAPKKIDEIIGNESAKEKIKKWMLDWSRGKKGKPLIVYGPTGTGKTCFAYALKEEFDLELIEMNASQFRDKKQVERIIANAMLAGTLSGKKKIILIDDVDVLGKNDRGGAAEISRLIKKTENPVILTAENAWERKISQIRMQCDLIQLRRITKQSILKLLTEIVKQEKIEINEKILEKIAENANGDVRSALNDLQASHTGNRDQEKDIFNIVRGIFKGEDYSSVRGLITRQVDPEIVKLWVDENIPYEYSDYGDIARAYYYLSRSDQFEGRIKASRWGYLRYAIDFFTAGVALSKTKKNFKFVKYKFPVYLKEMASSVRRRAVLKSIGKKIGAKTHCNFRAAQEYIPLIADKLKGNEEQISEFYKFEEAEMEYLLKVPLEKIEIKEKKHKKEKTRKGEINVGSLNSFI